MTRRSIERYQPDPTNSRIRHLDGIPWDEADPPGRWHFCWAQSQGWETLLAYTRRCACGAASTDGFMWTGRNSRSA